MVHKRLKTKPVDWIILAVGLLAFAALMSAPAVSAQLRASMDSPYMVFSWLTVLLFAPLFQLCAGYLLLWAVFRVGRISCVFSKRARALSLFLCGGAILWHCVYILQIFGISNLSFRKFFLYTDPYFQHLGIPVLIGALLFLPLHSARKADRPEDA